MIRIALFLSLLCSLAAPLVNGAEPTFTVPPIRVPEGFVVELAAAPPLVQYPLMGGFDERGRLFVAESCGENLKRDELERRLPGFVRMLEDTTGDGRFDKSTIFADRLTLPQGALWHDGALYVAAPPHIWRFEDTTGDGVADRRDVLVGQFGYTGNAADIHGCFLGPEGRIYWCDGRHGHEFRNERGELVSQGKAARIFSCRPDGTDLQVHCGGGMDNPVEVDFMPTGEMLGTVNLFYRQRGDCLVHWMRGGVYPRYDQPQCIAEFPSTGDLLSEVHDFGHVAVSGTTRYRGDGFGPEFRDNFFVTEFNTHKLVRATLAREGASFRVPAVEDFLVADSSDFHPTDVVQDADGSLLLIDTGGWFRIGCPTSQIAKPNVLGAIYRIRRVGATADDPRGSQIAWDDSNPEQLANYLGDTRPVVQQRAIDHLARHGDAAVTVLSDRSKDDTESLDARRNALWSLVRIGSGGANAALREALAEPEADVRQVAAFSLGANRDSASAAALSELLRDPSASVRRTAATALGQIRDAATVPALLAALAEPNERVLEHALIYALIEIAAPEATRAGLAASEPSVQRAALLALDQMPGGGLTPETIAPLLNASDLSLRTTAFDVVARHPDWEQPAAEAIVRLLDQPRQDERERELTVSLLVAFRQQPTVQQLVAKRLADDKTSPAAMTPLLQAIARMDLPAMPDAWQPGLIRCLQASSHETAGLAIDAAVSVGVAPFRKALVAIADDTRRPLELRLAALTAAAAGERLSEPQFSLLAEQIRDDVSPGRRLTAARAIGSAKLSAEQLDASLGLLQKAGPLEMVALLDIADQIQGDAMAQRLFTSLAEIAGRTALPQGRVQDLIERFPRIAAPYSETLAPAAATDLAAQAERLAQLEATLATGNAQRGRAVFFSQRAACYACHRIDEEGSKVGPDLSRIGERRSRRDLLEAILYPSASLARGFESYTVATDDGRVLAGMLAHETTEAIVLRTADQREVRIRRDQIEAITPSPLSIMPAGLEKTVNHQQLADLIAYLLSLK